MINRNVPGRQFVQRHRGERAVQFPEIACSGEVLKVGECGDRCGQRVGRVLCKGLPGGSVCLLSRYNY